MTLGDRSRFWWLLLFIQKKSVCVSVCRCVCVYVKANRDTQDGTGGKRWMSRVIGRGGGGIKWFNYKANTISLFLTRDFMVGTNVWLKQLSATNAKALHPARSAGPLLRWQSVVIELLCQEWIYFFFRLGSLTLQPRAGCKKLSCNLPLTPRNAVTVTNENTS